MENIKKIWPKWQVEEILGEGGFGKVYKAKRESFGDEQYSAIKVIQIPNNQQEVQEMEESGFTEHNIRDYFSKTVNDLVAEIKMMGKLKSASHIVSIEDYEVVEHETQFGWTIYIRMELLTNIQKHFKGKEISVNDVVKMAIDVLTALEFCHEKNIMHRDIKPANIFISEFGEYKLGDFGISREVEKTNATMSQKGTKSYMAPEMIRLGHYGKNVDLYALGLTMYELLNHGRMPFLPPWPQSFYPQEREEAMMKRLMGEVFPEIENVGQLNEIIQKACDFDPKNRYQSASEMKEALNHLALENEVVEFDADRDDGKTVRFAKDMFSTEETTSSQDEKTVGIFSNQYLFEDATSKKNMDFIFDEPRQEINDNSRLEPLTMACPYCGKTAYLATPHVYICGDCWKVSETKKDETTKQLASLYLQLSKYARTPQKQYETALEMSKLAPNSAQVYLRLGLYEEKRGGSLQNQKQYYEHALKLDSRDGAIYNNLAVNAIKEKNYSLALSYAKKAEKALKERYVSIPNLENTINSNLAICYEKTNQSQMAFLKLVTLYNNGYDKCTELASTWQVGRQHIINRFNNLCKEHPEMLPPCAKSDKESLKAAKSLYKVASDDEVLLVFSPNILFGGKIQVMALTTRAFYFFHQGEPMFISYYRLQKVEWQTDWQAHLKFHFTGNKLIYDIQFGKKDCKKVEEWMKLFTKEIGLGTFSDIFSHIFSKQKK